ncbi:MAG TPA: lipid-binding protein [Mucilaginibacter sp.]
MKKRNIYLYALLAITLVLAFGSCKKDPKVGGTSTQSLAGEWWVKLDNGKDATGDFGPGYYNFSTYNTASNTRDTIWVDDDNNAKSFWDIKGKVTCNVSNGTFSATNVANQDYTSTFTITNGVVLPNAAHAPGSGDKTDSIYCKISFSDDAPGIVHTLSGYKRTGFAQDDH